MQAHVLVVEDVREMADLISLYLTREGIRTATCDTAERGLELCRQTNPDLVILDINLPGMDGFEMLQALRKESTVPVLVVSARDTDEDLVHGLGVGADEFVTKPFSPRVLVARVRALLRRVRELSAGRRETVRFGPYVLDLDGCLLRRGGERVPLSQREYDVLQYLVANAGKPQTPDDIYGGVWKNRYGDLTAVGVYVQRLRRKIEEDPTHPRYIQTVHGRGYLFTQEEILKT